MKSLRTSITAIKKKQYNYSQNETRIDPLEQYRHILGVTENSSMNDIKHAFRTLAKEYHPDKNSDPSASNKFKEIVNAYEKLTHQ